MLTSHIISDYLATDIVCDGDGDGDVVCMGTTRDIVYSDGQKAWVFVFTCAIALIYFIWMSITAISFISFYSDKNVAEKEMCHERIYLCDLYAYINRCGACKGTMTVSGTHWEHSCSSNERAIHYNQISEHCYALRTHFDITFEINSICSVLFWLQQTLWNLGVLQFMEQHYRASSTTSPWGTSISPFLPNTLRTSSRLWALIEFRILEEIAVASSGGDSGKYLHRLMFSWLLSYFESSIHCQWNVCSVISFVGLGKRISVIDLNVGKW